MTMTIAIIAAAIVLAGLFLFLRAQGGDGDEGLSEADRSLLDANSQQTELKPPLLELEQADGGLLQASLSEGSVPVGRVAMDLTPGCFIVIDASTISRKHAMFEQRGDELWLTDLESANGSWVNGQQVLTSTQVFRDDRIRFDEIELVLKTGEPRPVSTTDTAKFATPPVAATDDDFGATAIMDSTAEATNADNEDELSATQIWTESPADKDDTVQDVPGEGIQDSSDNEMTAGATMIIESSPLPVTEPDDDATMLLEDPQDDVMSMGVDDKNVARLSPSTDDISDADIPPPDDDDKTVVELPPSIAEQKDK